MNEGKSRKSYCVDKNGVIRLFPRMSTEKEMPRILRRTRELLRRLLGKSRTQYSWKHFA